MNGDSLADEECDTSNFQMYNFARQPADKRYSVETIAPKYIKQSELHWDLTSDLKSLQTSSTMRPVIFRPLGPLFSSKSSCCFASLRFGILDNSWTKFIPNTLARCTKKPQDNISICNQYNALLLLKPNVYNKTDEWKGINEPQYINRKSFTFQNMIEWHTCTL